MAGRSLRSKERLDYCVMNGAKNSKSTASTAKKNEEFVIVDSVDIDANKSLLDKSKPVDKRKGSLSPQDLRSDMHNIEMERQRLMLEIDLAQKKKQIEELKAQLMNNLYRLMN